MTKCFGRWSSIRTSRLRPLSALALVACLALLFPECGSAANLTTTNVQGAGTDWNAAIWKTDGTGVAAAPTAGNTYQCVPNGVAFGNNTANTRIRTPTTGVATFPGDSLTLLTNTEMRVKGTSSGPLLNFPALGSAPGLILNGGIINVGDEAVFTITGRVQVASFGYICPGDAGGGAVRPLRGITIAGQLTGTGTLVIFQAGTSVPQTISGNQNSFSGQWVVKAGWLLGSGQGSLGTNSITVDPGYNLPLDGAILNVAGPAWFEPGYDLNSAGRLSLTNGGVMVLHQNCAFASAVIEGVALAAGVHSYAQLAAAFPGNFAAGGSGSITIRPYNPPVPVQPVITLQPVSFSGNAGSAAELFAEAAGGNLFYRWQKGTNKVYVNLVDTAALTGSQSNVLRFSALSAGDAADYRLIVTNTAGSATSQVATVTVLMGSDSRPYVTSVNPADGSTVASLTEIRVTFSEPVMNVSAADLLVNGSPASSVSGSGTTYAFTFTQPAPGLVSILWDPDNGIVDVAGEPLNPSSSWAYTLVDATAPVIVATAPAAGATVTSLTQVQVVFSEPVVGVRADDLVVNGFPALALSGSGRGPYVFQVSPVLQGLAQFSWSSDHVIVDAQSNAVTARAWIANVNPSAAAAALTNITINEFLAANVKSAGLRDEDGELNDWLEIANRGVVPVNLAGWSLTDDAAEPAQWSFPATNLGPGQFLIVFASGKDRRIAGSTLHTNFKLNSGGDYLGLYSGDLPSRKVFEYAPEYPEQRNDISYGMDAANAAKYFSSPTPGFPNGTSSITGLVARVHFSVDHGFFDRPFNLHLTTTTPGATLVYTTDGSQPAIGNGNLYAGPITISSTLVVRAAAFAPDLLPTPVETRTYLFIESIVRQPNNPPGYPTGYAWTPVPGTIQNGSRAHYEMSPVVVNDPQYASSVRAGLLSIPTMSLALPIPDLFDPNSGIYTHPEQRGPAWERACSMEIIYPDGSKGVQLDCGLQIQGGTQRDPNKNAKHSFRVSFKGDFGAGRFNHEVFEDSPVKSFNTLVLDGGINMWWHYVGGSSPADQRYRAQCVRDQYASDLMEALGQPTCHGRFHHIYLNGLYWGLHYVHERPDDEFAASYLGGSPADHDVLRTTTAGLEVLAGDRTAWDATLALVNAGLADNAKFLQLQQWVDVDNLIDYMIVNHWICNEDWPQHNWYVIRKRASGAGWKFISWDAEHVLKSPTGNRTTATAAGSPAQIYNALRDNSEFRLQFADHLQKAFFNGGIFYTDPDRPIYDPAHPERNAPAALYMRRLAEIDTAIVDESARWGGYLLTTNYTRNTHWLRELNNLLGYSSDPGNTGNFFPGRTATVLSQYKNLGLFPAVSAPVFNQNGGSVPAGFAVSMSNPNSGGVIYYTTNGTDPRTFGSGAISSHAKVYAGPVTLTATTVVKARILQNGSWSALGRADFSVAQLGLPLRITEIMYRPIGGDAYEYLELQNSGAIAVDLSGFSFQGISYVFPAGSKIGPGASIVLASAASPAEFASRYPGVAVFGYYSGAVANSGERIALLDSNLAVITSVEYDNSGGWPVEADGGGFSLEVLDPNGSPDDPANWRASTLQNGSPGLPNPPATLPSVRLNEVLADNAGAVTNGGTFPDWLEMHNAGSASVNLANWSLANGGDPRRFVFPTGTSIAPNQYLMVWCDSQTNAPGLHTGFALSRKGESIFLYDPQTNRVDAVGFGLQAPNYSLGRIGPDAAWHLNVPTPGRANAAATLGSSANVAINEWLANTVPGTPDWLELFNRSATLPVALSGLTFGDGQSFFPIRSASFLGPRAFVQLYADENAGPDHLNFKLSASGEVISVYDQGGNLLETVTFAAQAEGVSQGRLPDGTATIASFPGTASPGASNYVASYSGPLINELMAWNDGSGNTPDWLELYNPTASAYSLAGMSLGRGPRAADEFTFPASTAIAAGGYLRVWCSNERPASTNSGPDLNTGFKLSAEGEIVCLFTAAGQVADAVSFGPQVRDKSIGRASGEWCLLAAPTPGSGNSTPASLGAVSHLRLNELMAYPAAGDDWFELYNRGAQPVSLSGLSLTDNPSITGITNFTVGPLSFVGPGAWVKFIADGRPDRGPDHVRFALSKDGQILRIYDAARQLIDSLDFGLQVPGVSLGRLPDGAAQIVQFPTTPTPAASNYLPLENVVINEVLAHTDPPFEDAVELYNPSPAAVPLAGWFISNSESELKKYRIPAGASLPARGYRVFYEYQFNSTNAFPFTLNSAHGDSVYVSQADSTGNLTGYRAQVAFGASARSVSLGRFVTSTGADFVPLAGRTFGYDTPANVAEFRTGTGMTNAPGRVGPLVISEIMFHPFQWTGTNGTEYPEEEYVEIQNVTFATVPLYDPAASTNRWKLTGGIEFTFPGGLSMPAGSSLLVVGFDPVANPAALANFRTKYQVPANAPVVGPFKGRLNNSGESLALLKPDAPQAAPHPDAGFVPYILIEQVEYASRLPWPEGADGTGMSLQRRLVGKYGNEPLNWLACTPTAGVPNCGLDSDNDGLPDAWEIANGLDPNSAAGPDGANGDPDGDGFTNAQEYQAGTHPKRSDSYLKIDYINLVPAGVAIGFTAVAAHSYSIEYRDALPGAAWIKLADVEPPGSTINAVVTDVLPAAAGARFYRLATPRLP